MTFEVSTAYEILSSMKIAVQFSDPAISELLYKGRIAPGELCMISGSTESSCNLMSKMAACLPREDYAVLLYSLGHKSCQRDVINADSLAQVVFMLTSVLTSAPRVLFLVDTVNLLEGYRLAEVEGIIEQLLGQGAIVVTNMTNIYPLAKQVVKI
jgi:hypothetical protein